MDLLIRILRPRLEAAAHCDLPCRVCDPAQVRIEAESVKAIQEKYQSNDDPVFRQRCINIKEQRSELVKHHLRLLWTDYSSRHTSRSTHSCTRCSIKQPRRQAGPASRRPPTRRTVRSCWDYIAQIDTIPWETKKSA
jgi:nickel superoxide dismutase